MKKRGEKKPKKTRSAGGVVLNSKGEILVVSQGGMSVSLPKGHIERGEEPRRAALREMEEETGIPREEFHYVRDLGKYKRYKIGKHGHGEDRSERKTIIMYLYTTDWPKRLDPIDPGNPWARWVTIPEALHLLTHEKDKEFLKELTDRWVI